MNILIINECDKEMNKIFSNLKKNSQKIRLGSRSIVSILEKLKIKCYENTFIPLLELANINIVDNMNIEIHPWDNSLISKIDKSIIDENLGFTPTNKGKYIYINIPILTEESRKNLVKKMKNYIEHAKMLIRNSRKKTNQNIKKLKLTEDENKFFVKKIQKITEKYNQKIDLFFVKKKEEILKG